MKSLVTLSALLLSVAAAQASAQAPDAGEVKRVMDYYYGAQSDTPVLVDFKLCEDVYREGENKYNCKNEIDRDQLQSGASVYAWMNFMVPRNERGDVLLQLKHDGVIHGARKAGVEGGLRYRTWRRITLARPGQWELPILYDNQKTVREIDTVTLTVNDPSLIGLFETPPATQ